jgi:hypothetical protein
MILVLRGFDAKAIAAIMFEVDEELGKILSKGTKTQLIIIGSGAFILKGLLSRVTYDIDTCLLYTSPSPRDRQKSRMPSSA